MTGRLASAFIAEAGKPQKIYTVPAGKVFDGHIGVYNSVGTSTQIQVKHGQGIVAPAATFPLSNGEQIEDSGAVRPGPVLFDLGGNVVVSMNGSSVARSIDLTDQLIPVVGSTPLSTIPRDPSTWAVADRLCIPASSDTKTLRRYLGSVTPWTLGTYGEVKEGGGTVEPINGPRTVVGWGQYAAAFCVTPDYLSFATDAPTSGSVTWGRASFADLGIIETAHASYWGGTYTTAFVANGVFFLSFVSTSGSNYRRIISLDANLVGPTAQWNEFSGNIYTQNNDLWGVFYANNAYYFFMKVSSNSLRIRKVTAADLNTTTDISGDYILDHGVGYSVYGNGFDRDSLIQIEDGRIVWQDGGINYVLNPVTDTVSEFVSSVGDVTVSANYTAYHEGKLNPVNINTVNHSVPRDGAGDPANDRIVYTDSGIFKFVTDDTWSLKHVTDDAGWIDYNLSLADKAEVEYRGKMLNATDEIWVRSTQPNITVSVEGFLIDA